MIDKPTAVLLIMGSALLALTFYLYQQDRRFLAQAEVVDAVVTDKGRSRGSDSDSDTLSVTYEWPTTWQGHPTTRKGRDFWSGGARAWRALEPGSSTVKIAWVPTDDGRGADSRLYEQGFTGMPWPSLIVGLLMTGAGVFRLSRRLQTQQ